MPVNPAQPPKTTSWLPTAVIEWYERADGALPDVAAVSSTHARRDRSDGSSTKRSSRFPEKCGNQKGSSVPWMMQHNDFLSRAVNAVEV